jgi:hypothetical protein
LINPVESIVIQPEAARIADQQPDAVCKALAVGGAQRLALQREKARPGFSVPEEHAGAAGHIGELQIEIDPVQVATGKKSQAAPPALHVNRAEDYETDYAALTATFPDLRSLPVAHSPMIADPKSHAAAVISTTPTPAGSESQPVIKVISTIALVALTVMLFAVYIVVAVLSGGDIKFGN